MILPAVQPTIEGCHATGRRDGHAPGNERDGLRVSTSPRDTSAVDTRVWSENVRSLDEAINHILNECYNEAKRIVTEKREAWNA